MPRYVMLSTLGPEGAATLREQPERLKQVNADVEAMGVKVLEQFALLGPYDFLNILDAPDEKTMAKVAIMLGAVFLFHAVRLQRSANRRAALKTYLFSLLYLALLFVAMVADARL